MDGAITSSTAEPDGSRAGRAPIGEEIYEVLLSRILSAELSPGGRITIDAIARELGISQTPIREALHRLDADGVVVRTPHAGYRVAPMMTQDLFEHLVELRLLLEPAAARHAAERATDTDLAGLRGIADSMRPEFIADSGDRGYALFSRRDAEFHDLVALSGRNPFIRDSLSRLHVHVHLFRLSNQANVTSEAIKEHADIVAAIARRDPDAAAYSMRAHIEASALRFGSAFS